MTISQISIFLENRSGQLSEITNILSENEIDIKALNIAETADYGILRIITSKSQRTVDILKEAGFIVTKSTVVAVAVPNTVGGLNKLLAIISEGKIDIEYMYSIFGMLQGNAYMIFKVRNADDLTALLESKGVKTIGKSEIGIE